MPIIIKPEDLSFPSPEQADEDGLIACGGKISAERLLAAYKSGIFPWPHDEALLLWFCPDPRFVLSPHHIRINRSLRKALMSSQLEIKADTNFLGVISQCRAQRMHKGTWITQEMLDSYVELAQLGYAHSIEAYNNNILVGGLYGVSIGSIFFGESMFCTESYASKICLVSLAAHLIQWGFMLIDCQAHTDNLAHMGARYIKRKDFLQHLVMSQEVPTRLGPWHLNLSIREALSICKPS